MSVKEFSQVLKSQAMKAWFQRLSTDNILKTAAKDLRKKESGAEFNSFLITQDTIKEVIAALSDTGEVDPKEVTAVFEELKKVVYSRNKTAKVLNEPYVQGTALYFPRISFDAIGTVLDKGFKNVLAKARQRNPEINISDYFQKGHVFGIFPKKLAITRKSLESNTTLDPTGKAILVNVLSQLEKQLEAEDLATSNLKSDKFTLYAKYKKKPSNYLVELQLTSVNQASGREQADVSKAIRKFLNPGAVTFTASGIKFTEGAAEQKIKGIIEKSVEEVVGAKGSPSMIDLIALSIADAIKGQKSKLEYSQPLVPILVSNGAKIDTKSINKTVKREKQAVKKLKAAVLAVKPIKPVQDNLSSLVNLLNAINARLREQIRNNMGTGSSRNVLNYRTGRFANSARVERLSKSRDGMITAFYSYMRNPYATFSEGGDQQFPKTRDPKLLISKSIREIAKDLAYSRLRAVNV